MFNSFKVGFAAVLLASGVVHADDYVVEPTTGVGVSDSERQTVNELIKSAVNQESSAVVVEKDTGHAKTIKSKVVKLGEQYLFTLEKWQGSRKIFSNQTKVAQFSEADIAVNKMVRSNLEEKDLVQNEKIGEVTTSEAKSISQQREPTQDFYVAFGPAVGHGFSSSLLVNLSIGLGFNISPQVTLRPVAETYYTVGDKNFSTMLLAALEGQYYFTAKTHSPFIGTKLGYGYAHRDDFSKGVNFFATGASLGYRFFRTSRVNLTVDLNYSLLVKSYDGGGGVPGAAALRVGLNF